MPDDDSTQENKDAIARAVSPLLMDIGIVAGAQYKLPTLSIHGHTVVPGATDVPTYDGGRLVKSFGFAAAGHWGPRYLSHPVEYFASLSKYHRSRMLETSRNIVESNLDFGNPLVVDNRNSARGKHSNLVWAYGKNPDSHETYRHRRDYRAKTKSFYYYTDQGGGAEWKHYDDPNIYAYRITHNIFPSTSVQEHAHLGGAYPEILSGRIAFPNDVTPASSMYVKAEWTDFATPREKIVDVRTQNDPDRQDDLNLGIYGLAVPANLRITVTVLSSDRSTPHESYVPGFVWMGGTSGSSHATAGTRHLDFFPTQTAVIANSTVNIPAMFSGMNQKYVTLQKNDILLAPTRGNDDTPSTLSRYTTLLIENDPDYYLQGTGNYADALVNVRDFVLDGGTLVTTGKSNAFVGSLAGSGSPQFYSFSGVPRPSSTTYKTNTTVAVGKTDIIERLGGTRTFQMESTLTQKQQPLIRSFGSANIISIGAYLFETLEWWGGYPSLNYYLEYIPNAVEYDLGENGGKVIYVNGELSKNSEVGGLSKAFAEAILDPALSKQDDEADITFGIGGGEYYTDPNARPLAMTKSNLNMVQYQGGIKVKNTKLNEDISLVLTISGRQTNSIAPEFDLLSGDRDIAVSLFMPSGDVYATHRGIPDETTISVAVASSDNLTAGEWKYEIDGISGFDGNSTVIMSAIEGLYDWNLDAMNDILVALSEDIIEPSSRGRALAHTNVRDVQNFPRGIANNTVYHRLGDRRKVLDNDSARSVSFGPLVKVTDVKVLRIDDDLVLDVVGVSDSITIPGWFSNTRGSAGINEVSFFDGTTLSATELNNMAVQSEPDIIFTVISTDTYVAGTDANDNLTGHEGMNDIFFAGKGRDTITGNGGSNVYYYRRGDGAHTIINKKGENEVNALRFDFDITSEDINVSRNNDDLVFAVTDSGGIIVKGWYSDVSAKLDRAEFAGGVFLDTRDLEKLAVGKKLTARVLFVDSPEAEFENVPNNITDEEKEEREAGTASDVGGSSGCSTGGTLFGLLSLFGISVMTKLRKK